jgi:hypothetical protein
MMGPTNTNNKPTRIFSITGKRVLIFLLIVILVVAGASFFNRKLQQKNSYKVPEQNTQQFADHDLANHDYQSYQIRLTGYANDYIAMGKYGDAERVLNEIMTNVPKDKIISQTYRSYWYLYQKTGDTQNRKKYALLTAQKLRAEGQDKAAEQFEADAKG